jgi:hypothetical protein
MWVVSVLFMVVFIGLMWCAVKFGQPVHAFRRMVIFNLIFIALLLLFQHPIKRLILNNFEQQVKEVVSGNEFIIKGGFKGHRMVLASTELPPENERQNEAKAELERRLADKKVSLELTSPDATGPVYSVIAKVEDLSINDHMVGAGLLVGPQTAEVVPAESPKEETAAAPKEEPTSEVASGRAEDPPQTSKDQRIPTKYRFVIWGFLGILGSTGLAMLMVGNRAGWVAFLGVFGGAVWSIESSWREDVSIWPPIVGLALVFLLAGNFAKTLRQHSELQER